MRKGVIKGEKASRRDIKIEILGPNRPKITYFPDSTHKQCHQ
jgi:hypothetical protein